MMRKSIARFLTGAVILASVAGQLSAGGLFVLLGTPDASREARAKNAVLTLKLAGCHEPEKAHIQGVAVRIVNGQTEKRQLTLLPLSQPGMYAVSQQWPAGSRWVLQFVAKEDGRVTSTIVAAGPRGIERDRAQMAMRVHGADEVAALMTDEQVARR